MNKKPFLPALGILTALPASAFANITVPGGFGFLAPFWLSWITMGLVFGGIVLLETGVAHFFAKINWKESLILAIVANAVSSVLGLLLATNAFFVVSFLALLVIGLSRNLARALAADMVRRTYRIRYRLWDPVFHFLSGGRNPRNSGFRFASTRLYNHRVD